MDLTATDAAQLCGLSVRSVNALYQRMRAAWLGSAPLSLLSQASLRPMNPLSAPSVSGANVGVARVTKPSSLVYSSEAKGLYRDRCRCLQSHAASHYSGQSGSQQRLHTDGWRGCDGLVDLGLDKPFRVNHGSNEFVKGCRHTLTASSLFGAMPNIDWRSLMACDVTSSHCISRSLSSVSITAILISTRHCLN